MARALRAARKAGVVVQVEIDLERKKITLTPVNVIAPVGSESDTAINEYESDTAINGDWDHIQ